MKCPKCKKPMKWTEYTLARRPDALRGRDERAPIEWALHCKCGMWVYNAPEDDETEPKPRRPRRGPVRYFARVT